LESAEYVLVETSRNKSVAEQSGGGRIQSINVTRIELLNKGDGSEKERRREC